jgi:hypothetical protein
MRSSPTSSQAEGRMAGYCPAALIGYPSRTSITIQAWEGRLK